MKNKFTKWTAVLYVCAALLAVGFVIRLGADYFVHYPYGSAPFWLYVAERGLEYLLPAALCFGAARLLKKNRGESKE